MREQVRALLQLQWGPEHVASLMLISHETPYQRVYADKTQGGTLWNNQRSQSRSEKRCSSGRDRRRQIPNRRQVIERPAHIDKRLQVGHWECDTVIGANHKQAIVTAMELKSGYAVMYKVLNKTACLVGSAVINALKPFEARVNTLSYDDGKEFCGHARLIKRWAARATVSDPLPLWSKAPKRTSITCCGNTRLRNVSWQTLGASNLR